MNTWNHSYKLALESPSSKIPCPPFDCDTRSKTHWRKQRFSNSCQKRITSYSMRRIPSSVRLMYPRTWTITMMTIRQVLVYLLPWCTYLLWCIQRLNTSLRICQSAFLELLLSDGFQFWRIHLMLCSISFIPWLLPHHFLMRKCVQTWDFVYMCNCISDYIVHLVVLLPNWSLRLIRIHARQGFTTYRPRASSNRPNPERYHLDSEQVVALAYALHHYNAANPSLDNMRQELFINSFAAYFKHAPFMCMVNTCMLTYHSPDYLPTVSVPVRPAVRGSHVIMQPMHPLYANWTAMLQRTSKVHLSHHNVQVEPCWTGCFWPEHCVSKDKFAFFSYVIWVDYILGTKPNHTHSSSSLFCVDRMNNALH